METAHVGVIDKKSTSNNVHANNESRRKNGRKAVDEDIRSRERDEPSEDETEGNELGVESDGEELPVLPKVPVKRKLTSEPRVAERNTQRGRAKSQNLQTKKTRTPQIDASVITQLEFGARPQNCVSISPLSLCVI